MTTATPGAAVRFPPLDFDKLTGIQKEVADEVLSFSLNRLGGPFNMLLRSPQAAQAIMQLSRYLRFHSAVPDRLAELAILIHARLWTDQYEWCAHADRAVKAGLAPALVDSLRNGRRPAAMADDEAIVFAYCLELARNGAVGDATFARAREVLGEMGLVDLTVIMGQYVVVSFLLSVSQAPLPEGKSPALAPMDNPFPS